MSSSIPFVLTPQMAADGAALGSLVSSACVPSVDYRQRLGIDPLLIQGVATCQSRSHFFDLLRIFDSDTDTCIGREDDLLGRAYAAFDYILRRKGNKANPGREPRIV